ncbi:MAG: protein translocase subunit SecD [Vicinamibacteria bacterium]
MMDSLLKNPFLLWLAISIAVGALIWTFMRKELRTKAILYSAFLIACFVSMWPIDQKIKLGLDLKGGMHLVLKVSTDDALKATVSDAVSLAASELTRAGMTTAHVHATDTGTFMIEGIEPARMKDARTTVRDYFRSTEWNTGEETASFKLSLTDVYKRQLKDQTVQESIRTLERRVNVLGVAEPVITAHGSTGDQILVQLPGVTDVDAAKRMISTTAQLSLKLVDNEATSKEMLLPPGQTEPPANQEIVTGTEQGVRTFYLVQKEAVITGRDLKNARPSVNGENGLPDIQFSLTPTGATKFGNATGNNVGKRLAVILDGTVESAPVINSRITDSGVIQGSFSQQQADELAKVLRAGALPATLTYLQQQTVGASLGRDSIRSGVIASAAGMAFITIFMLVYYRAAGINAVVALMANLLILLGAMAYFGATLTLPGIAGVILTVGIGVDTNVLVFERIREELRMGKTVKTAISNGFDRVWLTILDTHATALIAAAFLFQFGTGAVRGFAVTLVWGLTANVFASYFVSKFLFEWALGNRKTETLSI